MQPIKEVTEKTNYSKDREVKPETFWSKEKVTAKVIYR